MLRRMFLLLSVFFLPAVSMMTFASDATAQVGFEDLAGDYVVVSIRRNSFVTARASNPLTAGESPMGQSISIASDGLKLEGIDCDRWQLVQDDMPADLSADRLLTDLHLSPADSPSSSGDKRLLRAFEVRCEGELFTTIYQVDQRVLALSWQNSELFLILERPLNKQQISRLQAELTSLKFYGGQPTGVLDDATLAAVRQWYAYRQPDSNAAIPHRPAITENLLDAMNVIQAGD